MNNKGLGSHDAIAILNLSRTRSRIEVFFNKTGKYEEKEQGSDPFYEMLKVPVLKRFAKEFKKEIVLQEEVVRHPKYPFLIGNTLGYVLEGDKKGLLMLKLASDFERKEWKSWQLPLAEEMKMQHNLNCFGAEFGYIVALIGNHVLEVRRVEREPLKVDILMEACIDFWGYVERKEMPPMDGSKAAEEWLKQEYPEAVEREEIRLPDKVLPLIEEHEKAKEELKEKQEEVRRIENQLKLFMGENERGYCGCNQVEWRNVTVEKLDQKLLREKYPKIAEECTRESTYRRFSITRV